MDSQRDCQNQPSALGGEAGARPASFPRQPRAPQGPTPQAGSAHLSGCCQVPVTPLPLKLPVGGKQHVFGEGRGVSEWTKGCGPWGSGRCWGGVLFSPHLPEAGKLPQALVEDPSPGPEGSTQGTPGVSVEVHWTLEPREALPHPPPSSVTGPTLHRPWETGEVCVSQPL